MDETLLLAPSTDTKSSIPTQLLALQELTNGNLWYGTDGPRNARIMIVGEAWGSDEDRLKKPFVGQSGQELDRMLAEAGIERKECLVSNVVAARPEMNQMYRFFFPTALRSESIAGLRPRPEVLNEIDRLYKQIEVMKPSLIIAVGNYALWALTDKTGHDSGKDSPISKEYQVPTGIMSLRGSMEFARKYPRRSNDPTLSSIPLLPIIHPAAMLRNWSVRAVTVHDLKRSHMAFTGDWRPSLPPVILTMPSFTETCNRLRNWLKRMDLGEELRIANDIETIPSRGLISCIGFADSTTFAMVVPLLRLTPDRELISYWSVEEETAIVRLMRQVLVHPNVRVEGQNYIYDTQYIQFWWAVTPRLAHDTMLAQQLLFPGTPKDLGYLSSLYCKYHIYWKDDSKEWDTKGSLEQHLLYNGYDCIRTFEIASVQRDIIPQMTKPGLWADRMKVNELCRRMITRGIAVDKKRRAEVVMDLTTTIVAIQTQLLAILPQDWVSEFLEKKNDTPWYRSPMQQKIAFKQLLGIEIPLNRKTKREGLGKEELEKLRAKYPAFKLMFNLLADLRSCANYQNTSMAKLEPDNRLHCSFNPGGTETFRLSSSKNAFGRATNMQNLPTGDDK